MRKGQEKEYKGYIIRKQGKQNLTAWKDGHLRMYANTEKQIIKMINSKENEAKGV